MEHNKYTDDFLNFIADKGNVSKEKATDITEKIWGMIAKFDKNSVNDAFTCLKENDILFDEEGLNEFLPILVNFLNNIPRDSNGGLTPEEKSKTMDRSIHLDEITESNLPIGLFLPSDEQIKKEDNEFRTYTDEVLWHKGGEAKIAKLKPYLTKYRSIFEKFPEWDDLSATMFDQYLAALYNTDWEFTVYSPKAKLGEDLYLCTDNNGYKFIIKSHAVTLGLEYGCRYYLSLLACIGSIYESWGPVLNYTSTNFADFEYLAKSIAPALYKTKGFSAVVKFNPVIFWATFVELSSMPLLAHKDKIVFFCFQKGVFKDNRIPTFSNRWEHKVVGKKQRWIYNIYIFLNRRGVYYNEKNGEVYIYACNIGDFDKLKKTLKDSFIAKDDVEIFSLSMARFVYDVAKKDVPLFSLEEPFNLKK